MEFTLKGEFIQLDKLLKAAGLVGTGGEAKLLIQDGLVLVDGEVETRRGRKIRAGMRIDFDAVSLLVTKLQDL
jgi:ribosome-associated protein